MGCSTDLDILEPKQPVAVIYSFINPYDSIHFVRVQKTFLISEKSDIKNINNDSLLFKSVLVSLQGKKGDSILWTEDFREFPVIKDTGFFPSGPYSVYGLFKKLKIKLGEPIGSLQIRIPDIDSLILIVRINDLGITTRSSTEALPPGVINPITHSRSLSLYQNPTQFSMPILSSSMCIPIGSREICYQKIEFTVYYKDYFNYTSFSNQIDWATSSGFKDNVYELNPERVFNRMKLRLPKIDSLQVRVLDSIDIRMLAPSKVFSDYWYVQEHWEEMDMPPFSNFDNSYGLFVTLMEGRLTGLKFDNQSMDSLCNGSQFKEMKFKHW